MCVYIYYRVGGFNPSEKYESVSWDYEITEWKESHKIHGNQTTKQLLLWKIPYRWKFLAGNHQFLWAMATMAILNGNK
jgi:hypothetical protein